VNTALAYLNWGRWVVDCPQPGCTDARLVNPARLEDVCANGHPFTITMPPPAQAAAIVTEMAGRAREQDRSWYPAGHARAEMAGQPTGQTPEELRVETRDIEAQLARRRAVDEQLEAALAAAGISLDAQGQFEGRLG
jgi:hypothetical protein